MEGASDRVIIVSKLDYQTFESKFESHSFGLVQHLSKEKKKSLVNYNSQNLVFDRIIDVSRTLLSIVGPSHQKLWPENDVKLHLVNRLLLEVLWNVMNLFIAISPKSKLTRWLVFFYGISTLAGYLISNLVVYIYIYIYKGLQMNWALGSL